MARYYGVINGVGGIQSAAAPSSAIAPGSLASLYGQNLAGATAQATSLPLPASLDGITVTATDSTGAQWSAPLLYVSPGQINFLVPDNTVPGTVTFAAAGGSAAQTFTALVQRIAPTLFSMSGTGAGVAAAFAVAAQTGNSQLQSPVPVFQCDSVRCVSVPIALGVDQPIYVSFYGTGIRNRSSVASVSMAINKIGVPVLYAGPAPGFVGLDQVNVGLPLGLRGSGESNVVLTVDGQASNVVTINVQ
jgi:uncharacterized protein (TIGR03437 family)